MAARTTVEWKRWKIARGRVQRSRMVQGRSPKNSSCRAVREGLVSVCVCVCLPSCIDLVVVYGRGVISWCPVSVFLI